MGPTVFQFSLRRGVGPTVLQFSLRADQIRMIGGGESKKGESRGAVGGAPLCPRAISENRNSASFPPKELFWCGEQIRKTQDEPQWIVAQGLLSALTIPGFK